jgi:hypothetical protein
VTIVKDSAAPTARTFSRAVFVTQLVVGCIRDGGLGDAKPQKLRRLFPRPTLHRHPTRAENRLPVCRICG